MIEESIKFYYKATELKDLLRQGPLQWRVDKDRIESIAEHTFGCLILAISLVDELRLNINMDKVLKILTIHELEEIAIGDVTPLDDIDKKSLKEKARKFVVETVKELKNADELVSLTDEYNNGESQEAQFAKAVDKLECVLEFKKYQDKNQVDLSHINEHMLKNKKLKDFVDKKIYDLADIFFLFHMPAFEKYGINEEFWFKSLKNL